MKSIHLCKPALLNCLIYIFYYTRRILMQLSKCEKNLEWAAQAPGPPGLWVRCKVTAGEKWDPHKKKPHQNSDDRKSAPAPGSELALVSYIWSAYVGVFFSLFCFLFFFSFFLSKYPRTCISGFTSFSQPPPTPSPPALNTNGKHGCLRCTCAEVEVLLYVHRNCRLIRDGSPGRPPRLSHSS